MDFGVFGIWIDFLDGICPLTLHPIALHLELCRKTMIATVLVQHRLLGITMQIHTLLGMKAGVHMHPYAYIIIVWHYNATSYLDGYEGRRTYVLICSLGWLNIRCDGVRMSYGYTMLLC